jgi:outer membrane immunogenic protein
MTVRDSKIEGVVMKFATFGRITVTALPLAAPLGVASVASAADMPVKAPKAAPPPAFDWNGFYVGAYAGAAWMDQANTSDPCQNPSGFLACVVGVSGNWTGSPTAAYDMGPSFIGGGTVGYNWQPTPYTLLGLENDFGYLHLKGSANINTAIPAVGAEVATTKLGDWYDAFTARVGAVDGHAMFYVKGGGAAVRYSTGVVFPNTALDPGVFINTTTTKTLTGWAAGGGIEYGIDMHWSVKAEYLVLGVPRNVTNCGPGGPPAFTDCAVTHTPAIQTITLGLNYRFH